MAHLHITPAGPASVWPAGFLFRGRLARRGRGARSHDFRKRPSRMGFACVIRDICAGGAV
jgi:hypothetical protein